MADAYTAALTLLSARELSESQLRARLIRRQLAPDDINVAIDRLKADGTLDDRRVARALARMESGIRHRGRARVIQKIRQAGIDADVAEDAVKDIFEEIDEDELLANALDRRLRGKAAGELDERGRARIVRALVAQGFSLERILKRLKTLQ
ncbi:MAG TPA: regulatory protein RecX [Vicinamibacterales bacterium]|nr:regulatory protein RecX [Vicinamibacterales bacterium]